MASSNTLNAPSIYLRQASAKEMDGIKNELNQAGLPTLDISEKALIFGLYDNEDCLVGTGGLELYRPYALLRSVSVKLSERSRGFGKYLVKGIETFARNKDVEHLYLLTTTAAVFFENNGYQVSDRLKAPASIQATAEFSALCPSTAILMHKKLVRIGL